VTLASGGEQAGLNGILRKIALRNPQISQRNADFLDKMADSPLSSDEWIEA
jgi:hypothetical protein